MTKRDIAEKRKYGMIYEAGGEILASTTPHFSEESYHRSREEMTKSGAKIYWEKPSPTEEQEKLLGEFNEQSRNEKKKGLEDIIKKLNELGQEK